MYNCLYKHATDNENFYKKQFGFLESHSIEHAIVQLVGKIRIVFKCRYFVDLSKAFDTVNYKILIFKLDNYGVRGENLLGFISYLTIRTQFIKYKNSNTSFQKIICGVSQGSVFGALSFFIYVNDLKDASKCLDSVMFADDTNIFYYHKNIENLFCTIN